MAREADAVSAFMRKHEYRAYYSLADSKYAGSAMLVRRSCRQPTSLRYSLDENSTNGQHHPEGRVIIATFGADLHSPNNGITVMGTYSPNNGITEASFARRREWDAQCHAFLRKRCEPTRPGRFIWLGDLNVAAGWEDVGPSPEWFRNQNGQAALHEGDKGQPGFTGNEQTRFAALLEAGQLVDAYRHLHPVPNWQLDVTWRGTPGVNNPAEGRYYNKGMRIDYCLVSKPLVPSITRAVVHGKGADRHGFLGSDHCPLLLELRDDTWEAQPGAPVVGRAPEEGSKAAKPDAHAAPSEASSSDLR